MANVTKPFLTEVTTRFSRIVKEAGGRLSSVAIRLPRGRRDRGSFLCALILLEILPLSRFIIDSEMKAVFLDRDGTLIEEANYLHRPEQVRIFPGVGQALRRLQDEGFALFMVSNQSGVGRGYFTMKEVEEVNAHLLREIAPSGVRFEKIYIAT